ncbi:nitrogenase component 1 [Clostridium pasteurianum]|uniref:Nitrogenase molybdenum-iron protein, alpha and beta chains n=1 Tax=Clostridium pasteurianum BC1 TaxID=86416 RepID=R4KBM8_CLOPA|nr:nitrogenase component 1 [Clostridium pasteurianum]AGK97005.1 nitrogenase molybdenum-iron protein, alpha and beta chains [Clostridium pasteurianum BC1]
MAKVKKINLDFVDVENREKRLGTITAWDGSASDLVKESNYQIRALKKGKSCGGERGTGCKLCELKMPFNQQTMCSQSIVACQVGNIPDAILIEHSSIGCSAAHPRFNVGYKIGLIRRGKKVENIQIVSTNLLEKDMVFGATQKLRQSIQDAWVRFKPKAIFISAACATAIIGEDIASVAREAENELGIPVIPLSCEGFRSKHWSTGFDISQHGILRQIVNKHPKKQKDLINIIALWGTDYFSEMLNPIGLRVNYVIDMATVDELAQSSEAAASATFCFTLGSYMAAALEQEYGVPEIKAPQPYGLKGTDTWLREIGKLVNKENQVEEFIKKEHERVKPKIDELKEKLKGVRGFVATGSAYAHGIITVLKELGIEVNGSVVFHHDPVYDGGNEEQDTLKFLVDNYGDVEHFTVSKTQQFQFYGILRRVSPDFIIIRHNGLAPLAAKVGIPAFPLGDEHLPFGYQGIIRMGEALLEVLAHKKFGENLKRHVKLPYTKWWLDQEDPFILAKHPEILDEE